MGSHSCAEQESKEASQEMPSIQMTTMFALLLALAASHPISQDGVAPKVELSPVGYMTSQLLEAHDVPAAETEAMDEFDMLVATQLNDMDDKIETINSKAFMNSLTYQIASENAAELAQGIVLEADESVGATTPIETAAYGKAVVEAFIDAVKSGVSEGAADILVQEAKTAAVNTRDQAKTAAVNTTAVGWNENASAVGTQVCGAPGLKKRSSIPSLQLFQSVLSSSVGLM